VTAVPIPAVAVRELVYDANGSIVKPPRETKKRKPTDPPPPVQELEPGQTRKEVEGVFVRRSSDLAEFIPIKLGISGDKYFEVLGGLSAGDEVVDRAVQFGPHARRRRPGQESTSRNPPHGPIDRGAGVNKLLESAGIAFAAIWGSKLRSLMTVLGNIVAVTSIIAVVSLIQGLNASVTSAIMSQAGADSFSIQQFPVTPERRGVRGGPRKPAHHDAGGAGDQTRRRRCGWSGDGRTAGFRQGHLSRPVDRQHQRARRERRIRQLLDV
jgi:hypothetical protein